MSSTDDDRLFTEERDGTFGKWVSLTCVGGDRFDIDCGRVHCEYSPVEYMATVHGDAIVIVPSAFQCVSQMVTVNVLSSRDRNVGGGLIEIAVRRQSIRCCCPYRFAYVDGLHYEVMGVSKAFTFHHRDGRLCDCDNDFCKEPPTNVALSDRPDAAVRMGSFISLPPDAVRFNDDASQCLVCRIPSNHRIVLEHLKKNINHLSDIELTIDREYIKYFQSYKYDIMLLYDHMLGYLETIITGSPINILYRYTSVGIQGVGG